MLVTVGLREAVGVKLVVGVGVGVRVGVWAVRAGSDIGVQWRGRGRSTERRGTPQSCFPNKDVLLERTSAAEAEPQL